MIARIRHYIPDEIIAIFITAMIGLITIVIIINVSHIIAWIRGLPLVD
jgi:hypothetical protein